ncbi:MAG: CehA/McbA family metallohydrolase [Thermodesulfobacteriota bacterium]
MEEDRVRALWRWLHDHLDNDPRQAARYLKLAGQILTYQTWNFEYLEVDSLLLYQETNFLLFADQAGMHNDESKRMDNQVKGLDLLRRLAETMAASPLPPREPGQAVGALKSFMGPEPAARYEVTAGDDRYKIYWGDNHIHSALSYDAAFSPRFCYAFAREVTGLDFAALTDHAFGLGLPNHPHFRGTAEAMWGLIEPAARRASVKGRFTAFSGFEWSGRFAQGHRNVFFQPGSWTTEVLSYKNPNTNTILKLWNHLEAQKLEAVTVAHHTAFASNAMGNELSHWDRKFDRLIEVTSDNGEYEFPQSPLILSPQGRAQFGRTVSDALAKGLRYGLVGQSDSHLGMPGLYIQGKTGYGGIPGFTAVISHSPAPNDIYEAMRARRCYATDSRKIFLDFRVNQNLMGSEITLSPTQEIQIEIRAIGTGPIKKVELLQNERIIKTFENRGKEVSHRLILTVNQDRTGNQEKNTVSTEYLVCSGDKTSDFFRVKVTQDDGHRAWSSPIWVDYRE